MYCYKLIVLFIQMSFLTSCLGDNDDEAASVTPKLYFVGGETTQNTDDPAYTELAKRSLQKYLQSSGDTQPYEVVKIEKVLSQVVAGIKTTIDFIVTNSGGDTFKCKSIILEQAWKNLTDIDVTCGINNQAKRTKRESPVFSVDY